MSAGRLSCDAWLNGLVTPAILIKFRIVPQSNEEVSVISGGLTLDADT
jgi:hypothetical protein